LEAVALRRTVTEIMFDKNSIKLSAALVFLDNYYARIVNSCACHAQNKA
jgi:hypothetical protein